MRRVGIASVMAGAVLLAACEKDTGGPLVETFEVTIENISEVYPFSASGVFNTPEGAQDPGPILPGGAYEVMFYAGPGSRLSFATMFVQSNDLFYAPAEEGIALFDGAGMPTTGDVTSELLLWDAGTEIDQEPGLGADQAPRQSGPDTGAADDDDSTVHVADDEYGNLPPASDVIRVTLSHAAGNLFTLRIENVSDGTTLMTSDGATHPVPLAPGVFVVHTEAGPLFEAGEEDPGNGLEGLAEDGAVMELGAWLAERTGYVSPVAPGVYAVHPAGIRPIFEEGEPDRGEGLEQEAEEGNPEPLSMSLAASSLIEESGVFNTPVGAGSPGPIMPGSAYSFTVTGSPGDRLSLATMLGKSNDLFFAFGDRGIRLFNGDDPISGQVEVYLWDAGTEVNEAPGAGPNQAPFQSAPDSGVDENGTVRMVNDVNDGFTWPDAEDVVRITITPMM